MLTTIIEEKKMKVRDIGFQLKPPRTSSEVSLWLSGARVIPDEELHQILALCGCDDAATFDRVRAALGSPRPRIAAPEEHAPVGPFKRILRSRGLTYQDVGEELEVSRQAVSLWGKKGPPISRVPALARLFGTTEDFFMERHAPTTWAQLCSIGRLIVPDLVKEEPEPDLEGKIQAVTSWHDAARWGRAQVADLSQRRIDLLVAALQRELNVLLIRRHMAWMEIPPDQRPPEPHPRPQLGGYMKIDWKRVRALARKNKKKGEDKA